MSEREARPDSQRARRVLALLDRAASVQREDLRSISGPPDSRELELVRRVLEGRSGQRRPRRTRWLFTAAACLAIALAWLAWTPSQPLPPGSGEIQLGTQLVLRSPLGAGADTWSFEWSYDLESGGWFVVLVGDPGAGGSKDELLRSPLLFEPRWEPLPEQSALWPNEILWEVRAYDGTGRLQASGSARASRSQR